MYRDHSGRVSDGRANVQYGSVRAEIENFALALAQAAEPLTDCEIIGVTVTLPLRPEYSPPALPDSDTSRAGVFIFESVVEGDRFVLPIPSIKTSKLLTTGIWEGIGIDTDDPDVAALIDLIANGDGTLSPQSYAGNDLLRFTSAYRQHRGL
jgi:hypothetical protein